MTESSELAALTQVFIAERPSGGLREGAPALEPFVRAALHRVEKAWPGVRVDPAAFLRHLARVVPAEVTGDTALAELQIEDLYLAFACSRGVAGSLEAFDAAYGSELRAAFSKMRIPAGRQDDLRQRLWQKLFLESEGPPRVLEYSGRGKLRHWFRVTVVRALLDDLRREKRVPDPVPDDTILGLPSPDRDPELEHLRRLYSHEFRLAFEQAVLGLVPEDRNVLRCYYSQSMTVDQIAAAFGVHRATAARRVNRARETLVAATRQYLSRRLKLTGHELESVIRLIESNLHVSVLRLL